MRLRCFAVGVLLLGFMSAPMTAQSQAGSVRIPYTSYIGLNPLIVPFDLGAGEFEVGVAQGTTIGGSVSYLDYDDDRFTSADLKVRYYPGEVVLRGFSVGFTAGYLRYSVARADSTDRAVLDGPTIGIVTDYNWLLGGNQAVPGRDWSWGKACPLEQGGARRGPAEAGLRDRAFHRRVGILSG